MGLYFTWFALAKFLTMLSTLGFAAYFGFRGWHKTSALLAFMAVLVLVFVPVKLKIEATDMVRNVQNQEFVQEMVMNPLPEKVTSAKDDMKSLAERKEEEWKAKADLTLNEALATKAAFQIKEPKVPSD